MALPNLSHEQLRTALKELEQASYNHQQWSQTLYATLTCHLTPDERDTRSDAHKLCRFGQWYYKSGTVAFAGHPGFAEIGLEHEHMHQHAASLLRMSAEGLPISVTDYERFVGALKRLGLEISSLQHELERTLANIDPLTGALNRVEMLSELREQQEFVRRGRPCVVAMMDLDHFKSINDRYGHPAGDKVLIGVAHHVLAHLRPFDRMFRYGGEEFLVCLADSDLETGHAIIDRLRQELAALPFKSSGSDDYHITVSFGVSALDPDIAAERSIDRADKALYVAKQGGRNRVVDWDPSMNEPAAGGQGTA
jgi:diguanylate cyclase (GGDEF)-like protein